MIFFFKLPSTNTDSVVVFNSAELIRMIDPVTLSVVGCMECRTCPAGSGSNVTCGGSVTANIGVPCLVLFYEDFYISPLMQYFLTVLISRQHCKRRY